jgi:hypothetical protein
MTLYQPEQVVKIRLRCPARWVDADDQAQLGLGAVREVPLHPVHRFRVDRGHDAKHGKGGPCSLFKRQRRLVAPYP